ncbi:MAG: nucleoid occlusion factor SlmA [Gammaproteobacteria bacterium RIFOXYA12_FULL_61_12]|nr:MAG: nucleoid occlusion factor SlmA [Gammaproteobacteria bacterium RIFOXYA12_FULL_61_12]OGT90515.1 MAG: nucleoid occlusion factor SlmA [Gammaproteobacteria bacterium RIFOXYD12_FULL_61_37]
MTTDRNDRKQQILEALARLLEQNPGERITTAVLAKQCGVSEAALYRHFASKARMYEALIEFAEETVFSRINRILEEEKDSAERCSRLLFLVLGFAEKNPGITRILLGDALVGEQERLLDRVEQFFTRLETQLKQVLRETAMRQDAPRDLKAELSANLLLTWVEGRMHQYLRTHFRVSPLHSWDEQWRLLADSLFHPSVSR